jgi:hypothetical protein
MTNIERWLLKVKLRQLGEEWDRRLQLEWMRGRPARQLARDYGLEPATVEAIIPRTLKKRASQ